MSKVHKIEIVHEDPKITIMKNNLQYSIVKWILTIISLVLMGVLIHGEIKAKGEFLALGIFVVLTILFWVKEIKLLKNRKRKFGKRWRFFKDPLMKEFFIIIILVLIACWLIFL